MSASAASELRSFLEDSARPDSTFRLHELQGFLFAIASAPETIQPSEWLPEIGGGKSLGFSDESEAQRILGHIFVLYNEVNTAVLERSATLPAGCEFADDILANFDENASISQWARGFAIGHQWLEEAWEQHLGQDLEEECSLSIMILTFFGSRQMAKDYHREAVPDQRRNELPFVDYAETMRDLFPEALASYAELGRSLFEASYTPPSAPTEPARNTKVGRNDPCPCGSRKKYKKCCGSRLH